MNEETNQQSNGDKVEKALMVLINKPVEPGTLIKAELFEELLGIKRTTSAFSWLISDIRRALYSHGWYLSGEGYNGEAYEILNPRDNYWVAKLACLRAERDLEGKLLLLTNTRTEGFSALEKKRHENMVREISLKSAALQRASEIDELLKRRKSKTIENQLPEVDG